MQQADVVNERLQGDRTVWCKRDAHFAFAIGDVDIDSRLLQQQRDNVLHLGEHGQMQRSATLASEQRGDERRITTRCHCLNKTHNSMSTHTHTHTDTHKRIRRHTHTHTHTHTQAHRPTHTHTVLLSQTSLSCRLMPQSRSDERSILQTAVLPVSTAIMRTVCPSLDVAVRVSAYSRS